MRKLLLLLVVVVVAVVVVLGTSLSRASDSVPVLREGVSVWWECVLLL